jgi:hypothetical protein
MRSGTYRLISICGFVRGGMGSVTGKVPQVPEIHKLLKIVLGVLSDAMRYRHDTPGEQLAKIVFGILWLLSRPFVGAYYLLGWFVLAVTKEAGNKVVTIVGGLIGIAVVIGIFGYLTHLMNLAR